MKPPALKSLLPGATVVLVSLALTVPAGSDTRTEESSVSLHTVPLGITAHETLVVRAREAGEGTSRLDVVFMNDRDEVVRRVSQTLEPGQPAKASLAYEELGTGDPFAAVHVRVILTHRGPVTSVATASRVLVAVEVFNRNSLSLRAVGGWSCAPVEHRSGGEIPMCDDGIVGAITVTGR